MQNTQQLRGGSALSGASSSSSSASASPSLPAAKSFSTASSDFALPFGGSRDGDALLHPFQSLQSAKPISIPSSPSLLASQATPTAISISPSKLSPRHTPFQYTHGSAGLGLASLVSPSTREAAATLHPALSQPHSPTMHASGDSWLGLPSSSTFATSSGPAPLLRRGPGMTSPGFALGSPARYRRASMLGREVTPFQLDQADEDQQGKTYKPNDDADDGDDEMMQMDEDTATASRAPSTPTMGPPGTPPHGPTMTRRQTSSALSRIATSDSGQDSSSSAGERGIQAARPLAAQMTSGSPLQAGGRSRSSSLLSGNVARKGLSRRGSAMPLDRSVLRVAASLQDEDRPEDSEIASEAKLQKRLGGNATVPRTPRLGGERQSSSSKMNKSPFLATSRRKHMWDDRLDDIQGVFVADGLDDADSSDFSSEGEGMAMYYSRTSSFSEDEDHLRNHRTTTDENMAEDPVPSRQSDTGNFTDLGSISEAEPAPTNAGANGSLTKRKGSLWMGFRDKGHAHKWSPGSATTAGPSLIDRTAFRRGAGSMDVETSPRIYAAHSAAANARLSKRKVGTEERYGPYKRRAVSPMNLSAPIGVAVSGGGPNSPSFLPVASPSSSFAAAGGILYRGTTPSAASASLAHHYARYSTSPTISRPCTPTHSQQQSAATLSAPCFSPAGSGPGYGSGALGLSISANFTASPTLKALQQEESEEAMDQRVGMLGLS